LLPIPLHIGEARKWTRQGSLAMVDVMLHSKKGQWSVEEMKNLYKSTSESYMSHACGSGGSLASWSHMSGGYDAKYYSYLWSRVIACDLYSLFVESGDSLNREIGMKYRREILEPSGTVDSGELVRNYLGRDVQADAFLNAMGYNTKSS